MDFFFNYKVLETTTFYTVRILPSTTTTISIILEENLYLVETLN